MKFILKIQGICLLLLLAAGSPRAQGTGAVAKGGLDQLKIDYARKVLPILRQSCFACHGPQPQDTDHVADPLAQRRMNKLIKRAKYQFPMFEVFPYANDDDPEEGLRMLVKSVKKNAMPPKKSQKLFNMGQPLSQSDRKIILDWARRGLKVMKSQLK